MKEFFAKQRRWILPVGVIVIAYAIASVIRTSGPKVEVIEPEVRPLVVRVVEVQPESARLSVHSQGQVDAEHMIDLINEMPGRIVAVMPAFVAGGYFKKGDVLIEIDPTDYELAKVRAAAAVAEEQEELEIERSEAELANQGLFPLREAKVASAEAKLRSAEAELAQADADLKRTRVRAPFDGRVLFTSADLGQYLSQGEEIGRLYSTRIAEVRLPLSDEQLRHLDFPFGRAPGVKLPDTPVELTAKVAGEELSWAGRLDRMEGAVDPDNRVWYAVARVDDPYGLNSAVAGSPLAMGLFVEAEITGRMVDGAFRLPRVALRNGDEVLIVDAGNKLRSRQVEVLRTDFETVLIASGLQPGDTVCVSPIEVFVDGLQVSTVRQADKLAEN